MSCADCLLVSFLVTFERQRTDTRPRRYKAHEEQADEIQR